MNETFLNYAWTTMEGYEIVQFNTSFPFVRQKNIQIIIDNLSLNYGISVPLPISSPCFMNTKKS